MSLRFTPFERDVAKVLAILSAHFQKPLDNEELVVKSWARALGDLAPEAIEAAADEWLRIGKSFPTAAHIRELAADRVAPKADPDLAWALVLKEARKVGVAGKPRLSPEIRDAIESCGGWRVVCLADLEKSDIRSRFIFAYRAILQRSRQDEDLSGVGLPEGASRIRAIGA